jgi:predicted permease
MPAHHRPCARAAEALVDETDDFRDERATSLEGEGREARGESQKSRKAGSAALVFQFCALPFAFTVFIFVRGGRRMSQLWALVWLKWALYRNSMRSRRAVVGKAAALLGMLAGLVVSLLLAGTLGVAAYAFMSPDEAAREQAVFDGFVFLFFIFTTAFMMWALMPLALGGGSRFEPGRMLLYPVSLGKLFAFDLLSDLTSLTAVFAVPSIFAMGLGAGLASGRVWAGLGLSAAAVAFGLGFAKLLSVGVGALMRQRRTRGETLLALLGALLGLSGALMGQLMPFMERYAHHFERAVWTPPGAAARALTRGLQPGGEAAYAASLALLVAYALLCVLLAFRVARRTALGGGGGGGGRKPEAARRGASGREAYAGWRVPLLSAELSAVFEKELRYAARNAQLRVIVLMAVGLTVVLRMSVGRGAISLPITYTEGAGTVFTVLYIFALMSPLTTNLFGYEGAGMRVLVLSPVARRTFLLGKNLALTLITAALVAAGVLAGGLIFRDLTWETLLFALLAFVAYGGLFNAFGNWLSLQFPKRIEFGKRMSRTGIAGLLLVPFFFALLLPPALAVLGAHLAGSRAVKYAILAAFAILSVVTYALLLALQGRTLARRELDILEAVTGRGGEGDSEVLG